MADIRKIDIANFICRCINEMESDGFQTWESSDDSDVLTDPVANAGVEFGFQTKESLWFRVGGREFLVKVTMPRHRNANHRPV